MALQVQTKLQEMCPAIFQALAAACSWAAGAEIPHVGQVCVSGEGLQQVGKVKVSVPIGFVGLCCEVESELEMSDVSHNAW